MTPFTSAFTTIDITAPATVDISPLPNASGVTIYAAIRVKYNEPIDPARFAGTPIALTLNNVAIDGRLDYALGNTVVVFSPNRPLTEDLAYQLVIAGRDRPGRQPAGTGHDVRVHDDRPHAAHDPQPRRPTAAAVSSRTPSSGSWQAPAAPTCRSSTSSSTACRRSSRAPRRSRCRSRPSRRSGARATRSGLARSRPTPRAIAGSCPSRRRSP